jgi:hypothetical protein
MSASKFLAFGRLFDRSISVFLVAMGAVLAGATAISGI